MEKNELRKMEAVSLKDLARIEKEAKGFGVDLVLIGGYAVRAYTLPRSWRFTKDIDFITTRKNMTALHGILRLLEYDFEETEFGVKGSKKINNLSIEIHTAVDKIIDWSTGQEYPLSDKIFSRAVKRDIEASFEENKGLKTTATISPIEDVIIMKLVTERSRDRFDAIAMILDSFDAIDIIKFTNICKKSKLDQHIRKKLEAILADIKNGLVRSLWKEFTDRVFIREQEVNLKEKINKLLERVE